MAVCSDAALVPIEMLHRVVRADDGGQRCSNTSAPDLGEEPVAANAREVGEMKQGGWQRIVQMHRSKLEATQLQTCMCVEIYDIVPCVVSFMISYRISVCSCVRTVFYIIAKLCHTVCRHLLYSCSEMLELVAMLR